LICGGAASAKNEDEDEILIVIDEVKPDDAVDETAAAAAAAAAEVAPPSSSTLPVSVPPENMSVADSGRELLDRIACTVCKMRWLIATEVVVVVCMLVCLLDTTVGPTKTAEPI